MHQYIYIYIWPYIYICILYANGAHCIQGFCEIEPSHQLQNANTSISTAGFGPLTCRKNINLEILESWVHPGNVQVRNVHIFLSGFKKLPPVIYGRQPKNRGFYPPNHPLKNRGFPLFSPSILGEMGPPLFLEAPI